MDKRLFKLLHNCKFENGIMLDTYDQKTYRISCTIKTNIDKSNLYFIMEEWYLTNINKLLHIPHNKKKLDGKVKIVEMPHGYFGGSISDITGTIKSSCAQYNTIILEPKIEVVGHIHKGQSGVVYGIKAISPTITTNKGDGQLIRLYDPYYRIRKMTEREVFRLMGVHDEDSDKIRSVVSKSQCYKLAGNSIVVDVLEAIFRELLTKHEIPKFHQLKLF